MTFRQWLLAQVERTDWIGQLARHARADRALPREPLAIWERARSSLGGDAEMLRACEDALREWNGGEPYPLERDRQARRDAEARAREAAYLAEQRAAEDKRRRERNAAARRRRAAVPR